MEIQLMQPTFFTTSKQRLKDTNQIRHSSEQYIDKEETALFIASRKCKKFKNLKFYDDDDDDDNNNNNNKYMYMEITMTARWNKLRKCA